MNYRNPQLLDELAAQFALGTLRGPARQRFERICQQTPAALQAVHRWEDRLFGLAREIKPVAPPASVLKNVRARLGHERAPERSGFFGWWTRTQLALAASIATAVVAVGAWMLVTTQQTQLLATFAEQQSELWRVEAPSDRERLVITRSASLPLEANRDYELWALPDSGAPPVSLGLMPKTGTRDLSLNDAQRLALAGASKIAISLEPIGGSTTGAPTGPVLFVAEIARAG